MHPRNWVEISRGALRRNLAYVRGRLRPGTEVCAVVKADAYGHGAVECARVFVGGGARWLAVTSPEEGARLRRGLDAGGSEDVRILVLAGFARGDAETLLEQRLTPAVWDPEQVAWLAEGLARRGDGAMFPVHVKFESGMGRLGVTTAQEAAMAAALAAAPGLRVEAVFSHLAAAEGTEAPSAAQRERLLAAAARFAPGAATHLLNSEGALRYAGWGGLMVRSGLALYGYSADAASAARLEPALSWKTRVVGVKDLPAGHGIGYGALVRAPRAMRIAVIAAGYADGYRRQFWPGARVLIGGREAPVVGAISMDLTTVDVTELPAPALGEEVTLVGRGAEAAVTAVDLARLAGTIPYEILCGLSARVERRYLE